VVLPAAPFGLAEQPAQAKAAADAPETPVSPGAPGGVPLEQDRGIEHPVGGDAGAEAAGVLERPESGAASSDPHQPVKAKRDIGKQKKLVDDLLKNCMARMCDEVGALLGGIVKVVPLANTAVTKERFLDQAGGKQIMTRMEIRGERKGEAFLFVDVKAAVSIGGALIMLPEGELEETVRNEAFSEDASDAYGEVSNIIAGVYSTVFEEQHRTRIGFVKTSIEPVVPVKIDPDSDETFPNQAYYLSLGQLHYNNKDLGRMQLLIPADVLELEELLQAETPAAESGMASGGQAGHTAAEPASPRPAEPARLRQEAHGNTDILIVTDDDAEGGRIAGILTESGYVSRLLHFKDPVHSVLTPRLQMVLLVMKEVSEQGFGVAIKINSAGHMIPLVAAGPAWTRTLVLKAVKYGACDILITPASPDDVRDKLAVNLVRKAA
jgi:chemotaxis protein CheY-P-specific phosphatase CheC